MPAGTTSSPRRIPAALINPCPPRRGRFPASGAARCGEAAAKRYQHLAKYNVSWEINKRSVVARGRAKHAGLDGVQDSGSTAESPFTAPDSSFFSPLFSSVFTPHVGELSPGPAKLGVSGPVKLDPSDDKRCPGGPWNRFCRGKEVEPRGEIFRDTVSSAHTRTGCAAHTRQPAPRCFLIEEKQTSASF